MTRRATAADLARLRAQLSGGARTTTYAPRRLPAAAIDPPIPLRLGLGWPHPMPLEPEIIAAGFLANALSAAVSALFDPYSLAVEDAAFTPPRVAYWVSDVRLTGDPNRWCHVYSRDEAGQLRINNVDTSDIFGAFHWPASVEPNSVPYLIPYTGQPEAPFGTLVQNQADDALRIFAIGPYSVGACTQSEQDVIFQSGAAGLLCRTPIGSKIDEDSHRAWLATAVGQYDFGWADSAQTGWYVLAYEIEMAAPPASSVTLLQGYYAPLQTAYVAATLIPDVNDPVAQNTDFSGPEIDVGLSGGGEISESVEYGGTLAVKRDIVYPWQATVRGNPQCRESMYGSNTRLVSGGQESTDYGDWAITCVSSNQADVTIRYRSVQILDEPIHVADHVNNYASLTLSADSTHLYWGEYVPPDPPITPQTIEPTRGLNDFTVYGGLQYPGAEFSNSFDVDQTGSAQVTLGANDVLLRVDFHRRREYGTEYALHEIPGLYQDFLDNPYGWIGNQWGTGFASHAILGAYTDPSTDEVPIKHYEEVATPPPPHQTQATIDEIDDTFDEMASAFIAETNYDNPYQLGGPPRYRFDLVERAGLIDKWVTWKTRDYFLYDEDRGVYLWIEGDFHAAEGVDATLTVRLHLRTAAGASQLDLYQLTFAYPDLLPLRPISGLAVGGEDGYVPLPYVRLTFAPLWTHQGHAPGLVYVTPDEVAGGAQHKILGNFVLVLRRYDLHEEGQPTDGSVHFTPYQLVDMLYAYVYGRGYGWYQDGRGYYYVDDTALFAQLDLELFHVPHAIQFDDFSFVDWKPALGAAYDADDTTRLYRV